MICDRSKDWGLTSTKLNVSSETSADFPIANSDFQILYKLWRNVGTLGQIKCWKSLAKVRDVLPKIKEETLTEDN